MSRHPAAELKETVQEQARIPSTSEISAGLEKTKGAIHEELEKRSPLAPEQRVGKDTEAFLESSKHFLEEKNKGDIIQKLVYDANKAVDELTMLFEKHPFFIDKYQALLLKNQTQDLGSIAKNNLSNMRELLMTLINSAEFRGLFLDFVSMVQEMVQKGTQAVSETVGTPSTTGVSGTTTGVSGITGIGTPTGLAAPTFTETAFGQPTVGTTGLSTGEPSTTGIGATTGVSGTGGVSSLLSGISTGTISGSEAITGVGEAMTELGQKLTTVTEGTTEEMKQKAKQRFFNLAKNLSANPNYVNSIDGIFQLFDQARFLAYRLKEQVQGRVETMETPSLNAMWDDSKLFLYNFSGQQPVDALISDFRQFIDTMSTDDRLSQFMSDFRDFVVDLLKNPDKIDSYEVSAKYDDLYSRGQEWMNSPTYNSLINKIWLDLRVFVDSIKTDVTTQKLATDAEALAKDLFLDEKGRPSLNIMASGLNNLRSLVAPILKKNLQNVTLPGLSGEDETYQWRIDSLVMNMSELVPDNIELEVWGKSDISLTSTKSEAFTFVTMWIRNVGVEAKDLKFHFKRKVFPKIEDEGVADVSILGKNVLKVVWRVAGRQDEPWVFDVFRVNCSLDKFDITVKESQHSFLMKLLTTLFSGSIRRSIEHGIESNVKSGLREINDQLGAAVKVTQ